MTEAEEVPQGVESAAEDVADTGLDHLSLKEVLVILIVEKAEVMRAGAVEAVLHADVVDEGLLHPGGSSTGHHAPTDDDADAVVEEALSYRVGIVGAVSRCGLVVGDAEVDVCVERLPEERIDL